MEHCDGEIPAKRPKLSDGGGGGAGSEDCLSVLPDDLLIQILLKLLDAPAAARTGVLSPRWRRLWTLLPELYFPLRSNPQLQRVRLALTAHEGPVLRRLDVDADSDAESVAAWLPVAARRLSGRLVLIIEEPKNKAAEGRGGGGGGGLELPCFENATWMHLSLGDFGLAVPPLGVFAGLTRLFLSSIDLHGSSMLGDAVSSPRCPALQTLTLQLAQGVGNLTIHSNSLLEIKLMLLKPPTELDNDNLDLGNFTIHSESLELLKLTFVHGLQHLDVMAPSLMVLTVKCCFVSSRNQPVTNISTPRLKFLCWNDAYHPSSTHFGNMENLKWLSTFHFLVYGHHAHSTNAYCARLLRRFELVRNLRFKLLYMPNMTDQQYVMGHITKLPDIACLSLTIEPEVHSFGASVFHVLRMATSVRKLGLTLDGAISHPEVQPVCQSGCVCEHPSSWKTEELALNRLKGVEIHKLRGTEHEAALIKRLFAWAIVLKRMTVTFDCSVTESKAKVFFQMLQSFSRPEICMKGPHFA